MRDQDRFLEKALLADGVVNAEQLETARRWLSENGSASNGSVDLVDALLETQAAASRDIAMVKADVCETAFVDLASFDVCYANSALVPRSLAERFCVFPLFMIDGVMTLGMDDPLNLEATDQVRDAAKCEVDPLLCDREQLRNLIARAYSLSHGKGETVSDDEDEAEADVQVSQPVIAAVNQLLADACEQRASDIHLNPDIDALHLRYRIDGVLHQRQGPPLSMHPAIVQRFKVMANLDLTQTRRPQDGKFRFRIGRDTSVDVRISTIPTVCGENVVLRLLTGTTAIEDFKQLGMNPNVIERIESLLTQPHGMLLVTGPTGSGKTTTLYTALAKLNVPSRNVMTIEDPVEIRLPLIRQVQVNPEIGLTFANALRSMLRQDPDVVLVGEIRDNETATIALQAALTGHLVLSTVHTNDAVGAVARLQDFGLPPFVINSSLLGVIGQRLVRKLCQHCAGPDKISELLQRQFKLESPDGFMTGRGCARCGQAGYRGRLGIYELLEFTAAMRNAVEAKYSIERLREVAVGEGMRLMWLDGLDKARLGQTTLAEIAKVASVIAVEQHEIELAREEKMAA